MTLLSKIVRRPDLMGGQQAKIVKQTVRYMHVEFTTPPFGFVYDVKFSIPSLFSSKDGGDEAKDDTFGIIHVCSASRIGYGDLGVNRKRVQRIRQAWNDLHAQSLFWRDYLS